MVGLPSSLRSSQASPVLPRDLPHCDLYRLPLLLKSLGGRHSIREVPRLFQGSAGGSAEVGVFLGLEKRILIWDLALPVPQVLPAVLRFAFACWIELKERTKQLRHSFRTYLQNLASKIWKSEETISNHVQHTHHHESRLVARRHRLGSKLKRHPGRGRRGRTCLQPGERDGGAGDEDRI